MKSIFGPERLESREMFAASLQLVGPATALFEGEQASFTLRLSEPVKTTERVIMTTVAGTATYGSDYFAPVSTQIVFAPGQIEKTFAVQTLRDPGGPKAEGRERFQVVATPVTPGLGTRSVEVTIADYAPPPVITVGGGSVVEGNGATTTIAFSVGLSGAYPKAVTVPYQTRNGTASTADNDYVAASGVLTFAPDELLKTVVVTVNGDRKLEPDETFSLVLGTPTNATLGVGSAVATIVNDEVDAAGFQITLKYVDGPRGPVPESVRTVAEQAVSRWAKIITGDLPGVTEAGVFIDDFEMSIQMGLLGGAPEGPGGILANAAPTAFRDGGAGVPYAGITGLDPNDVSNPAFLLDIIAHEMGHAFGFTPGANVFNRWIIGDAFVGTNALREYNSIFAATATGVPLQAGVRAHWDETIFGNELMTPGANSTNFISRITVGALQDMGYSVNYGAAEPYVRPPFQSPQVAPATFAALASTLSGDTSTPAKPSRPVVQPSMPARPVAPVVATPRPATTPATKPAAPVVTTAPRPSTSVLTSGIPRV